jgi:excisionase family DNA binding protein
MSMPRVTIREAAKILGLSPFTVGVMVRTKRLPHYRIGGRIFFSQEELLAWIEAQHVPACVSPEAVRNQ